ncbi:MAG: Ig-like domain-containing protein [Acidobacteriota bacterium]
MIRPFKSRKTGLLALIMLFIMCLSLPAQAETYTYDSLHRLKTVTYDDGTKIDYTYDAQGNVLSVKGGATKPVTGVSLNVYQLDLTVAGATYALIPVITPPDATNKTVYWTSSNPSIASVSNGIVMPLGVGTATITVTTIDGSQTDTCSITVTPPAAIPVAAVTIVPNKVTVTIESLVYQLNANVSPSNATNKQLNWTSSNNSKATVDNNGRVTPIASGPVTITASSTDGSTVSGTCTVIVVSTQDPKLLMHMEGENGQQVINDEKGHTVTATGAVTSTADKKFGSSSAFFNSSTDKLMIPYNSDFAFGSGDFTVDTWVKFNSLTNTDFFRIEDASGNPLFLAYYYAAQNTINYYINNGTYIGSQYNNWSPVTNRWYHVAFVRYGTRWSVYIDGQEVNSGISSATVITSNATKVRIMSDNRSGRCYLDEFRVCKGVAKWTSSFDPPTGPYESTPVSQVALNQHALSIAVGQSANLEATVLPDNAGDKTIVWNSSNNSVATINNGVVTAVAPGTATISATAPFGGCADTCNVTVNPATIAVTGITLVPDNVTISVSGAAYQINATVTPSNATNKVLTWKSSNDAIATIDNTGKVTPKAVGTVTITATSTDGTSVAGTCTVTVKNLAIQSTTPANNAVGVSVNPVISVVFTDNILAGSTYDSISLKNSGGTAVSFTKSINNNILTLTPTATLAGTTVYIVTIPVHAVKYSDTVDLANVYGFGFTTKDPTPPVIQSVTPANNATNVALGQTITVVFSKNVQASTNYIGITLVDPSNAQVALTKSISNSTLTLTHANLAETTTFTLTIPAGAVKDMSGNDLAVATIVKFTTADISAPVVASTDPANNATGVLVTKPAIITFNEPITSSTAYGSITMKTSSGTSLTITKTISGNQLSIKPSSTLAGTTIYKITIPASAVKDSANHNFAASYVLTFTTEDKTAPKMSSSSPANSATGVLTSKTITVTFSENVQQGTAYSNIVLKDSAGATVTVTKSISGAVLTIDPVSNLKTKTTYTLTIPASSIKDMNNNNFAGTTIKFTTGSS